MLAFYQNMYYYKLVPWLRHENVSRWPVGQAVKTSPSHGENRGSIPLLAAYSKIRIAQPKKLPEIFAMKVSGIFLQFPCISVKI